MVGELLARMKDVGRKMNFMKRAPETLIMLTSMEARAVSSFPKPYTTGIDIAVNGLMVPSEVKAALNSLSTKGLVVLHDYPWRIELTGRGQIAQQSLRDRLGNQRVWIIPDVQA